MLECHQKETKYMQMKIQKKLKASGREAQVGMEGYSVERCRW